MGNGDAIINTKATKLSHKGHKMCFVALVNFLVTLVAENQMHGFLMVFNKRFASEKILKP